MSSKREQLVETAERLFYAEGYFATGIDRIIAEAGVARMTLYKHFASKEELVCAALTRRSESYLKTIDATLTDTDRDAWSTATAAIDAHRHWLMVGEPRGCMFMKAMGEHVAHVPRIAELAREHKTALIERIRKHVDMPSEDAATAFTRRLVLILEGTTAMAQIQSPQVAAKEARALAHAWLMSAVET